MFTVRMTFEKLGQAKYISHLDLMRCFERSLRRADIPFWFTEGFNPRPFLTFALPLSLGYTGLRESVDIKVVDDDYPLSRIAERMNCCLPSGLKIVDVKLPVKKAKEIAWSSYSINILYDGDREQLCNVACELLQKESIVVSKLNKKKQKVDVDIKRFIGSHTCSVNHDGLTLDIVLASGCTDNCNPSLVIDAIESFAGVEPLDCSVTRLNILDEQLKEFA